MSRGLLICAGAALLTFAAALISLPGVTTHADDSLPVLQTFVEELVEITPGEGKFPAEFQMGSTAEPSEQPVHQVRLRHSFAIARYEVPQNLYEAVMGSNPSRWRGPRNSAEMMTWQQARTFCEKLTEMLREAKLIDNDESIRLPTEAEWEYCCRAGTTTAYSFGDKATADGDTGNAASLLDPYAWHTGNAAGNDPPVGALKPNPWGLYDMHGYLREFTADAWHADYAGAPDDGSAWTTAPGETPRQIVVRGGSWKDAYPNLRSASRKPFGATARDDAVGFRCVRARVR
jgi:formylglycine-generating enzyme required for sulfatase activity